MDRSLHQAPPSMGFSARVLEWVARRKSDLKGYMTNHSTHVTFWKRFQRRDRRQTGGSRDAGERRR